MIIKILAQLFYLPSFPLKCFSSSVFFFNFYLNAFFLCNLNFLVQCSNFEISSTALFPRTAITNCHKFGGLQKQKCILSQFWGLKSNFHRAVLLWHSGFWGLQTFLVLWLHSFYLCFCFHMASCSVCVFLCIGGLVIGFKARPCIPWSLL